MEWTIASPQLHSTFASLGFAEGDDYHVNDDCLATLEEIYNKLIKEDCNQRMFRRAVGFGQNIKKDFVPILIHVKDNPKIVGLTIKILVNLTIPVECLLSIDEISKNNAGRHTIYELNSLLMSSKETFMDSRVTKSILDYTNQIMENNVKLSQLNVDNVHNCLLLLRNILHIPELKMTSIPTPGKSTPQNQILWNLFTQSIDKTLLQLIASPHATFWSITIVQLVALIYKDQNIGTLQQLLSLWFEASLSDSSEDNESNTSPPDQGIDDSSLAITSDPTSDLSDSGGNGLSNDDNGMPDSCKMEIDDNEITTLNNSVKMHTSSQSKIQENEKSSLQPMDTKSPELITSNSAIITNRLNGKRGPTTPLSHLICSGPNLSSKRECLSGKSEFSDCGYVTQVETHKSISTSSNEDKPPVQKPVQQKPTKTTHVTQKQRHNTQIKILKPIISNQEKKEKQRKKLIKRGKTSLINMKGLLNHIPTDEDITNVLKEFTVDFLLKGYSPLVQLLHSQLVFNVQLQIDTSHFFWLLTYFLKFAAQLELDLEFVQRVLSYEMISYLTYEGVNLCEQIQLVVKCKNSDLISNLRRIHLVITAIREFIQTIEIYKKISHLSDEHRVYLVKLQIRIGCAVDLRCLIVLLLRHYQPDIHSKEYLQDLIVTNHILLLFLDNVMNRPDSQETILMEHIQQFATVEVMHQYGLLLQDYKTNSEYVNDCIFTMMHHVAGDIGCINVLYQPNILKVFLTIWETNFKVCEEWFDLIDYVIKTFMKNPKNEPKNLIEIQKIADYFREQEENSNADERDDWTKEEIHNLHWNFMRCSKKPNIIENICSLYREEGVEKSHNSIIKQLFKQRVIEEEEYRNQLICTGSKKKRHFNATNEKPAPIKDEIDTLIKELKKQKMHKALVWLQNILLETCFTRICINKNNIEGKINMDQIIPTMEPIVYHNMLMNQSIPIVPWNNEQSTAIHNQTFLIMLHRLGFHLPEDSGKLFVRIPGFWTTDFIFNIASRLGPIDRTLLKFSIEDVYSESSTSDCNITPQEETKQNESIFHIEHVKKITTVLKVTEITSPNMSIKETSISTIEEKGSSWHDVIMKEVSTTSTIPEMNEPRPSCSYNVHYEDIEISEDYSISPPLFSPLPMRRIPFDAIVNETFQDNFNLDDNSICETASVTSDLTRMYVSDEEDQHDE